MRNASCGCGSGRRFKHCCGAPCPPDPASPEATLGTVMQRAIELQRDGKLHDAALLYEEALARSPALPDALHMLGVIRLQSGQLADALRLLHDAARAFRWHLPAVRYNLGLAVGAILSAHSQPSLDELRARYAALCDERAAAAARYRGRISVVVPSYNHAAYIGQALESVRAQTRPADEIVVIDDGSTDGSPAAIREALRNWPGSAVFRARENRGAAATINEAVAASTGDFVNVLNSDDRFASTRLAAMSSAIAATGAAFGFARATCIDAGGGPSGDERAREFAYMIDDVAARETIGFALLAGNAALSSGNLFFSRDLFERVGGFSDYRYNHDWDFALRASLVSEPVFVPSVEYEYRLHGSNTIGESATGATLEMAKVFARFYGEAFAASTFPNAFAPTAAVWGTRFLECVLGAGHASMLPAHVLEDCVAHARRVPS